MSTEILNSSDAEARANLFPQYLMKLLNEDVAPTALWWLPDGKAFALDPKAIDELVLDKYFQKTKYSSFIRRLHNEGYRRQTRRYRKIDSLGLPEGTVVLSHDLFQRERPELLANFYAKKNLPSPSPTCTGPAVTASPTTKATQAKRVSIDSNKEISNSKTAASSWTAAAAAVQEAEAAALLGLSQERLRPSGSDALASSSLFGPSAFTPRALGELGSLADSNSGVSDSLSKSLLALRQARLQRELSSTEALRYLVLQQQQQGQQEAVPSWPSIGGRSFGVPRSSSSESSSVVSAATSSDPRGVLDARAQLQVQLLLLENSRRQLLEEQCNRLGAMEALRSAAFTSWPL